MKCLSDLVLDIYKHYSFTPLQQGILAAAINCPVWVHNLLWLWMPSRRNGKFWGPIDL